MLFQKDRAETFERGLFAQTVLEDDLSFKAVRGYEFTDLDIIHLTAGLPVVVIFSGIGNSKMGQNIRNRVPPPNKKAVLCRTAFEIK
jgi:hypothetical protein